MFFGKKVEINNVELIEQLIKNEGDIIEVIAKQQAMINDLSVYVSELQKTVLKLTTES